MLLYVLVVTFVVLQATVLSTTIYLHRSLTHRGLELHPAIRFLMHLHMMVFTGVIPRQWAAVHRKHHQFSDKEGDPHSPYIYGLWSVLFGNYFYYRRDANNPALVRKYTPDYKPIVLDKIPAGSMMLFVGLGVFMLMFGWAWGVFAWVLHMVTYVMLSASINSLCHMIGYRNFKNLATNIRPIALLTGGEGLHNNHHEYPTSARFSMKRGEFDPAWPVICLLERFRLAKVNRIPIEKAA